MLASVGSFGRRDPGHRYSRWRSPQQDAVRPGRCGSPRHPLPEAADAVEEGRRARRMAARAFAHERLLELLEKLALLGREVDRRFDHDAAVEVALAAAAHRAHALAAQ